MKADSGYGIPDAGRGKNKNRPAIFDQGKN